MNALVMENALRWRNVFAPTPGLGMTAHSPAPRIMVTYVICRGLVTLINAFVIATFRT
jgi:hypothetical protein